MTVPVAPETGPAAEAGDGGNSRAAKFNWIFPAVNDEQIRIISDSLAISPILARLIVIRGATTPEEASFMLDPAITRLRPPELLAGMTEACDTVARGVESGKKICIYGDYDVDGITSTALLVRVLRGFGADCDYYIPGRMDEGYGLNSEAIGKIAESGRELIITVDCGSSSAEETALAKSLGLGIVVTDHHRMTGPMPPSADAVVNPMRPDCQYPFKGLSGAGVALKLAGAIRSELHRRGHPAAKNVNLKRELGLVALGTIADVSPLVDENRVLVKHGLPELGQGASPGLQMLKKAAGLDSAVPGVRDVAFGLAPRINAAGRMSHGSVAVELLISENQSMAGGIAGELDALNKRRQELQKTIFADASARVRAEIDISAERIIVLGSDDWHQGVIGIVASKLAEEYNMPALLVAFDGDEGTGSARSGGNFKMHRALESVSGRLVAWGGHEHAAGVTVRRGEFGAFKSELEAVARENSAPPECPRLEIDSEIPLNAVTTELARQIESLEPFGQGNPQPVFVTRGVRFGGQVRRVGKNAEHIVMEASEDGQGNRPGSGNIEAIAFRMGHKFTSAGIRGGRFDIAYNIGFNRFRGMEKLQLTILDFLQS